MAVVPHTPLIPNVGTFVLAPGTPLVVPASPERLALIRVESTDPRRPLAYNYELSILFTRVAESRWIVGDPDGNLATDDLQAEEVIPLQAGAPYPEPGRPFLVRDLPETWLGPVRFRALALSDLYGAPAPGPAGPSQSAYRFSDTSHPLFGEEVEPALLSAPNSTRMEGTVGLVIEKGQWTTMERVLQTDVSAWKLEKHVGAGRDPRLLGVVPVSERTPLFRDAVRDMEKVTSPPEGFEGPSSTTELAEGLVKSGLEPPAWVEQFITSVGLGPRTGLAVELRWLTHCPYPLGAACRLNLARLHSAERLSRRTLRIQSAARKNLRNPSFEGPEGYGRHLPRVPQPLRMSEFDKFVMDAQETDAFVMKKDRLMRVETAGPQKQSSQQRGSSGDPAP